MNLVKDRRGFSLLEVLLAMCLLSVALRTADIPICCFKTLFLVCLAIFGSSTFASLTMNKA